MSPRYANLPARDALVLEWLGDGNALDTNDGTKATLTATNVSYASCPVGYQKQWGVFNGSSSTITVSKNLPYGDFTVIIFASNASSSGNKSYYAGRNSSEGGSIVKINNDSGTLRFTLRNANGSSTTDVTMSDSSTSTPMFVVAKLSGTAMTLSRNLTQTATGTYTSGAWNVDSTRIGSDSRDGSYMNGNLVVRVFNKALTDTEILAYFHEFNRQLGGGSDFGAYIPHPTAYLEAVGEDTFYDIALGTKATRTAGSVATDDFGLSRAISGPNQSWTSVTGDSFVYWNNSGWKLEKNNAAVTATGINTANTVRCVLYYPTGTISTAQQTAMENILKTKYAYAFRRSIPEGIRKSCVLLANDLYDVSPSENDLSSPVATTPVRRGQLPGRQFNGSSYLITDASVQSLDDFTMACSVYVADTSNNQKLIVGEGTANNQYRPSLQIKSGGYPSFFVGITGVGLSGSELQSSRALSTGSVYRIGIVRVKSTGSYKIYVNGKVDSTSTSGSTNSTTSTKFTVGVDHDRGGFYEYIANGSQVFMPTIANRAFTNAEMMADFLANYAQ